MVPSESARGEEWEARVAGDYLDIMQEASALPFAVELLRMPNNTLGSYGMFLSAYALRSDRFSHFIFSEDDYIPLRPRFDEALVRMYALTFGRRPGVLAGLLQGRPIEPTSPWRLHCESSHIMSAATLRRLFRHAAGAAWGGHLIERALSLLAAEGICTTATRATSPNCEQAVDARFDRIQLAFGALLREAGVEARDWTAAYRTPYWDHSTIVDWSGAAHDWSVPLERVLIAPVQWAFAQHTRICCSPYDCIFLKPPGSGAAPKSCLVPRSTGAASVQRAQRECCPAASGPGSSPDLLRQRHDLGLPTAAPDVQEAHAQAAADDSSTPSCAPIAGASLLVDGRTIEPLVAAHPGRARARGAS